MYRLVDLVHTITNVLPPEYQTEFIKRMFLLRGLSFIIRIIDSLMRYRPLDNM